MTNKVCGPTTHDSVDLESVLSGSEILTRSGNDTDINFETAIQNFSVNGSGGGVGKIEEAAKKTALPVLDNGQAISATSTKVQSKLSRASAEPAAIGINQSREASHDLGRPVHLQHVLLGMPSWLTSLIFHLAVIMILAVVSVSNPGRTVIALMAAANESVEVEHFVSFDLPEPGQMESLAEEIQMPTPKPLANSDISPMLDEALLNGSLESHSQRAMFDSISTGGISESDLPRRPENGSTQFFGVEGKGSNFVFVIDCSGSMADYGRWKLAVRELKKSVTQLKKEQKFLVLLYNDGFTAMNVQAELVPSTEIQQKKAFKWLANNSPANWTFCAAAMEKALSLKPDAVFLLSDGEFNDRQDVFSVLEAMNKAQHLGRYGQQQIPIHTIALGSHQGSWTMKRIADENNGIFQLIE